VHAVGAGKCLDVPGYSTTQGTQPQIWDCNGGADQQWNFNANGIITNVQSGLCLDVSGGWTANGALVQLLTCNSAANQHWTLG